MLKLVGKAVGLRIVLKKLQVLSFESTDSNSTLSIK